MKAWDRTLSYEKYVPSEVDLYPCYVKPGFTAFSLGIDRQEGGYARVFICKLFDGKWRVAVLGADDYGFNMDVDDMQQAIDLYNSIQWVNDIPKGWNIW